MKLQLGFIVLMLTSTFTCPALLGMKREREEIGQAQEPSQKKPASQTPFAFAIKPPETLLDYLPKELRQELAHFQTDHFDHPAISFWMMKMQALDPKSTPEKLTSIHSGTHIELGPSSYMGNKVVIYEKTNMTIDTLTSSIWDLSTKTKLLEFPYDIVTNWLEPAFNRDGTKIVFTNIDRTTDTIHTQVWDIPAKRKILELDYEATNASFSPIHDRLHIITRNDYLECYDLKTGKQIFNPIYLPDYQDNNQDESYKLASNTQGTTCAVTFSVEDNNTDNTTIPYLIIFDLQTGNPIFTNKTLFNRSFNKETNKILAFYKNPEKKFRSTSASIIDINTGTIEQTLAALDGEKWYYAKWSPDGKILYIHSKKLAQDDQIIMFTKNNNNEWIRIKSIPGISLSGKIGNNFKVLSINVENLYSHLQDTFCNIIINRWQSQGITLTQNYAIFIAHQKSAYIYTLVNENLKQSFLSSIETKPTHIAFLIETYETLSKRQPLDLFNNENRKVFYELDQRLQDTIRKTFDEVGIFIAEPTPMELE